jgi:SAM-dependent methyltransferase
VTKNLSDKIYWSKNGGYYGHTPDQLKFSPLQFPSQKKASDRILEKYFLEYLPKHKGQKLLEVGCGGSRFLPYFNRIYGFEVTGIDYDEYAAELARANLEGHGVIGEILCRDALNEEGNIDLIRSFDIVFSAGVVEHFNDAVVVLQSFSRFLREGGVIFTTVPNFQGVNWLVQRAVDRSVLDMHVLHTKETLRQAHEDAGIQTLACTYFGVYNGWLTEGGRITAGLRRYMHKAYSWGTNIIVAKILEATRYHWLPETSWASPYILYVGKKPETSVGIV